MLPAVASSDVTSTSEPTAVVQDSTLTVSTPSLSGDATVGATLTVDPGLWTPGTTFEYQWLADGVPLAGATEAALLIGADHVGKAISVQVTGSNPGYDVSTVTSAAVVAKYALAAGTPSISGTTRVGYVLSADPGSWAPSSVSFSYQWYRAGVAITGATGSTYTLTPSDLGASLVVGVAGSKPDYTTATAMSAATGVVTEGTLLGSAPRITGTARVGYLATANRGSWSPAPSAFRYQWYLSGRTISGATAATYRIPASAAGARLTVRVTASAVGYTTVSKLSAATAVVAKGVLAGSTPRITGTARVGRVLTLNRGSWSPAPVAYRYQWYRSGRAIAGATAATYRIPASAAGARLTVRVTASKAGYTTLGKTSGATAVVAKGILAGSTPRITGTARVGRLLTLNRGSWSPAPVAFRYQWYRSGRAISGATGATYRIPASAAGATLSVRVTASKAGYTTLGKSSAGRRVAVPAPAAPVPVVSAVYYANCSAARAAGAAPIFIGQPGYRSPLDRDSDGIACE